MLIYLNEEPITREDDTCALDTFLIAHNYTHTSFAVMVNQIFVPRVDYASTMLKNHDRINIIFPNQGG